MRLYAIGAGIIALSLMMTVALHFRAQSISAQASLKAMTVELDRVREINEANTKEAERQLQAAKDNVRIVERVVEVQKQSTAAQVRDRTAIQMARRNDDAVANDLDRRVPDAVLCVLNGTCANSDPDGH